MMTYLGIFVFSYIIFGKDALVLSTTKELQAAPIIHWFAPFFSGGGYCSEAISFVQSLQHFNNVSLFISQHGDSFSQNFYNGLTNSERILLSSKMTDRQFKGSIVICHSEPGAWHAPQPKYHTLPCPYKIAAYKIGRTMFETDTIPDGWSSRLNTLDEVWVPTNFAYNIFKEQGVDVNKLHIIGEPVDTDFYQPLNLTSLSTLPASLSSLPTGVYTFLFIGKWESRKGIDILLKSYLTEFLNHEKVHLVILTNAYHTESNFQEKIEEIMKKENISKSTLPAKSPKISLLTSVPQKDMPILYNFVNALVIPTRGEGWGRPQVEAMAAGLPVITTNWSGSTEFLTEANSYPISVTRLVPAEGWRSHHWAEPNRTHLQSLLRHVYTFPEDGKRKGTQARLDMIRKYSLSVMGELINTEINRIVTILKRRRANKKISIMNEF